MPAALHIGLKFGQTTRDDGPFTLPLDFVTQSVAILAKRGVGKTYTAAVFAEELLDAHQVPVIVDPTGAHWGLKSSADGRAPGFPVVVFGGEHADIPLEEAGGEVVARAIVEQRFPAILDLSLFRKGQMTRFLATFFETLYRLNRDALHLICDEADAYAPQKPMADQARTLGAMEDIVRRGRIRGIGCTLITQRPAVLNKNVLTQCEMLVALRLVHPKDIDAVMEWVNVQADPATAKRMIDSLPSLPVGQAWFWSPGWGDIFARVAVRRRRTFDSSATPKAGETRKEPKTLASIDVAKLGAEIAATAERAKENDPARLKAELAKVRAELAKLRASPALTLVEVPVFTEQDRDRLRSAQEAAESAEKTAVLNVAAFQEATRELRTLRAEVLVRLEKLSNGTRAGAVRIATPDLVPAKAHGQAQPWKESAAAAASNGHLPKAERQILTVLAQFGACSKAKLAAIAGYALSGGGFNNALGALRSDGQIVGSDPIEITTEGRLTIGPVDPLPTGEALVQQWCGKLPRAERLILANLMHLHPRGLPKDELASLCGYEPTGGGFNNALGALRTLELITRGTAEIKLQEHLFA